MRLLICLPFRNQNRETISHTLVCDGCGDQFEGTTSLKNHILHKIGCLNAWGGNIHQLEKKVKAIFKSRRDKRNHLLNPEKERKRKLPYYHKEKETRDSWGDLQQFLKEGQYGPIFPCVSCHQLKWKTNVSAVDMSTLSPDFVDKHYVSLKHRKLFRKLDKYHMCRTCKDSIFQSTRPKMCTRNSLGCPWEDVPPRLLTMNEVIVDPHDVHMWSLDSVYPPTHHNTKNFFVVAFASCGLLRRPPVVNIGRTNSNV